MSHRTSPTLLQFLPSVPRTCRTPIRTAERHDYISRWGWEMSSSWGRRDAPYWGGTHRRKRVSLLTIWVCGSLRAFATATVTPSTCITPLNVLDALLLYSKFQISVQAMQRDFLHTSHWVVTSHLMLQNPYLCCPSLQTALQSGHTPQHLSLRTVAKAWRDAVARVCGAVRAADTAAATAAAAGQMAVV